MTKLAVVQGESSTGNQEVTDPPPQLQVEVYLSKLLNPNLLLMCGCF